MTTLSTLAGTALVTGASTGIGAVYADRLARRGHDLVLVARDVARMEALATRLRAETGRTVEVLPADLATQEGRARIAGRLADDAAISVLVNNAGLALEGDLLQNGTEDLERLVSVNVTAPTVLAAAAAKAFAARGAGAIINLSSVLALAPELSGSAYSGSKAYVLNLSQKLALVLKDTGVRVQAVLPGATRTEIWEKTGTDIDAILPGKVMAVGDLVDAALAGFDAGEVVTIPPLADEGLWTAHEAARIALLPNLSERLPAERYRVPVAA
ncbi:short-chain dehydrogenase [Azorhizobium oxalatiphilum]|uniref:NADP-dependent 3-hydroxy acid dehydrogenase YdfG n=1 Tax=Azorhizobium oxalatiphilum TaxID=980631 RepID=A0A917C7B8_9HYPH|nr:SDR family NAD(P)-dependent oxidoreductase [Azorhizobium oxalatiphilum]GGF73671.1 short-chain dehydrogenase [Azorhizobium oxalatiphilum]